MDKKQMKILGKRIFTLTFMSILLIFSIVGAIAQTLNINYVDDINLTNGVIVGGNIDSLKLPDGDFLSIQEVVGDSGIYFTLSVPSEGNLSDLFINARYRGGAGHDVNFYIYDDNIGDFVLLNVYDNSPNFINLNFDISGISYNNEVILLFDHPQSGVTSHFMDIDYLVITSIGETSPDVKYNLFEIDLNNTFNIILISLLIVLSFVIYYFKSNLAGGGLLLLIGVFLSFNDINLIISLIVMLIGVLMIQSDENLK